MDSDQSPHDREPNHPSQPVARRSLYVDVDDAFVGLTRILMGPAPDQGMAVVAVFVERSWDVELVVSTEALRSLADALTGPELVTHVVQTVDREPAVIAAVRDRFMLLVPSERLGEVFVLGDSTAPLSAMFREAAG